MAHQLVNFAGGVVNSDSQNTGSAVVERDASGNTFQNDVNSAGSLKAGGSLFLNGGAAITTTATGDKTRTVVPLDATAGVFTYTLPPAATVSGQVYWLYKKDSGGNLPTVKGNGSELINAANTYTGLTAQFKYVKVWSDGTNWIILGSN